MNDHTVMVNAIKSIREQLGCSLRESRDFYDRNPNNWQERIDQYRKEHPNGYYVSPEQKIRDLITGYYLPLQRGRFDSHHLDAGAHQVLAEIMAVLGVRELRPYTLVIADNQWRIATFYLEDTFDRGLYHILPHVVREQANSIYHVEKDAWIKLRPCNLQDQLKRNVRMKELDSWPKARMVNGDPQWCAALVHEESGFFCGDSKVKATKHA